MKRGIMANAKTVVANVLRYGGYIAGGAAIGLAGTKLFNTLKNNNKDKPINKGTLGNKLGSAVDQALHVIDVNKGTVTTYDVPTPGYDDVIQIIYDAK